MFDSRSSIALRISWLSQSLCQTPKNFSFLRVLYLLPLKTSWIIFLVYSWKISQQIWLAITYFQVSTSEERLRACANPRQLHRVLWWNVVCGPNGHFYEFQRGVLVNAVPVNSVSVEEVNMFTLWIVLSVQIRIIAVGIPPTSTVMAGTVIVSSSVVVPVMRTEHIAVVVVSDWCQRISGVAMVTTNVELVFFGLIVDSEIAVDGIVFLAAKIFHVHT